MIVMSPFFAGQHLEAELHGGAERRRDRTALILRVGEADAGDGELALLLHDGGGFAREDRIVVVADQLAGIAGAVRTAAQIAKRLRTRRHPLEIEDVLAPADAHHLRDAVGGEGGPGEQSCRDAEEQSLTLHIVSPSCVFWRRG